ncbi:phage tail tape measure protein [Senegalia massiliensis]|uniref:Phage tail tape measure protein n=1 Tax=Senegalia massiliensis TaxID=1720316 RepID=A0A845QX85_9CLOT|nr:phage tail tape measure protein [Senegalia massiliensis]NBI05762.1 phage tail tape measure protein [Senegalia massiliensis]
MSDVLRRVSTIFTIGDSDHNRKLKSINQQYKLTQSEIKTAGERMKAFGSNTKDLTFKQSGLEKQVTTLKDKISLYATSMDKASKKAQDNKNKLDAMRVTKEKLNNEYKEAVKVYGKESSQAQDLRSKLDSVNAEYKEQERVVRKNVDRVNYYNTEMNKTEGKLAKVQGELKRTNQELLLHQSRWNQASETLRKTGNTMIKAGDGMQRAGSNLNRYVTLPIMAMGALAVNEAVKFESSFTAVEKTVDGTTEQMGKLKKEIIDMSKEIPSTTHEISEVAAAAGQLGIQTENISKFSKVMIDLANSTNIVGEEGAQKLAKFANIVQMSEKDYDRLGSTIVDLGNNFSTTEADILEMSLRLAGAGKQIDLTESEILALATGLSSVGIEAQAGGSSFSKIMLEMQMAIQTNSNKLRGFANIAGMTTKEFKKGFEEDAAGAIIAFIEGLGKLDNKAKVLSDLDLSEIRVRDSLLRASEASDIFKDAINRGSKAWEENTALTNEANQKYKTTESQAKITKNQIMELARGIGQDLLPVVKDSLEIVQGMVDKFNELDPATQKNIIKMAMLSAAMGPVLSVTGGLTKGLGYLFKGGSKVAGMLAGKAGLTAATSGLGTAAGTAGGATGLGALSTGLGGIITTAAPYAAAIGAIGLAGYGLYKGLNEEVIPEVDLFSDAVVYSKDVVRDSNGAIQGSVEATTIKISEETQKQISSYLEKSDQLQQITHDMYTGLYDTSAQGTGALDRLTQEMVTSIITASDKQKNDVIEDYQEMFINTTVLTTEEQAEILKSVEVGHKERVIKTEELKEELLRIYGEIRDNGGTITSEQQVRINEIINEMKNQAVQTMTQNEVEQGVIMNRLKNSNTRVTAEMVGDTIGQMEKQRKETVEKAGQQRDDIVRRAEELRKLEGGKFADKADKIIEEANKQYEGVRDSAQKTKDEGISKLERAYGGLTNNVDHNTGKVLSNWDKIKRWWGSWNPKSKSTTVTTFHKTKYLSGHKPGSYSGGYGSNRGYALGTTNALPGLATVNEKGYEMMDLPAGTKIRTNASSEQMASDIAKKTAIEVSKQMINGLNDTLSSISKPFTMVMNNRAIGEGIAPIISEEIQRNKTNYDFGMGVK